MDAGGTPPGMEAVDRVGNKRSRATHGAVAEGEVSFGYGESGDQWRYRSFSPHCAAPVLSEVEGLHAGYVSVGRASARRVGRLPVKGRSSE